MTRCMDEKLSIPQDQTWALKLQPATVPEYQGALSPENNCDPSKVYCPRLSIDSDAGP